MLATVEAENVEDLMATTLPDQIRNTPAEDKNYEEALGRGMSEAECLGKMKSLESQNKVAKCFIGQGYNPTVALPVIIRNVLENPAWYTSYTPYQSEVAQGRMEGLFFFQSMVADLTGLNLANASLLDEATALAEGVQAAVAVNSKRKKVLVEVDRIFPQSVDVLRTRAKVIGVELVETEDAEAYLQDEKKASELAAVVTQIPDNRGIYRDLTNLCETAKSHKVITVVATDLLACSVLTPPGDMGADIAVGSAQRFGVPMGYGGPHAGFIACRKKTPTGSDFIRKMPGRFMGLSPSHRFDELLFRITLQTRETHVKREKATSNICTAQALLANMAAFYGMYHGPKGLQAIATRVRLYADLFEKSAKYLGYTVSRPSTTPSSAIFDTVVLEVPDADAFVARAERQFDILVRKQGPKHVSFSMHEQMTMEDLQGPLAGLLSACKGRTAAEVKQNVLDVYTADPELIPSALQRTSSFMTHERFNSNHTEMEMQRYLHYLNRKDISLLNSMMPLGSCTMKLNAAVEMLPLSWRGFTELHPFAPLEHARGYLAMMQELKEKLKVITGFEAFSLQPNSGANGEFSGLLAIIKYHESRGEGHRNICLIPMSAHGTNPASAQFCGLKVVAVECDAQGNTDLADLKKKLEKHGSHVSSLMITYPSTHGVFEEDIIEICELVHAKGGQVYMDGANMNAQVGFTSPGKIGADVCHLNLHKTFCIPHGGGGPGMGPIGAKKHLEPFLPGHIRNIDLEKQEIVDVGDSTANGAVSAGPFGSPLIQCISFAYLNLMGAEGLRRATESAILNANYVAARLREHYGIVFAGKHGRPGHECIIDCRSFKKTSGVGVEDIAKRLMDYGFHAPTMSWPVNETFMIEPTESESKAELDRFCEALIAIRQEIRDIEEGKADKADNLLKNAPHCEQEITASEWTHPYSREAAAFPLPWIKARGKFWPVSRVQNVAGDRNLICNCGDVADYTE